MEKNKTIIELGDILEIKYQYRSLLNENINFKSTKSEKITIGKDQLFIGLDDMLIGEDTSKKTIEIELFTINENETNHPEIPKNDTLAIGIKVIKHEKHSTHEILDITKEKKEKFDLNKENEQLKEQNNLLIEKIAKLEKQINENINAFKLKNEEIVQKAQNEVAKIKNEIKEKAKEEINENKKFAIQSLIEDLIEPLNNLHMSVAFGAKQVDGAVKNYVQGFNMIVTQLFQVLETKGVSIIEPKVGDIYNPEFQHADDVIQSNQYSNNQIIKVVSRGYSLNGRVIKPAKVIVAK